MQQTHISPKCIGGTRFGKIHRVLAICHPVNCCNAVHFGSVIPIAVLQLKAGRILQTYKGFHTSVNSYMHDGFLTG